MSAADVSATEAVLEEFPSANTGVAGILSGVDHHYDEGVDRHLRYVGVSLWVEVDAKNQVVCRAMGLFADTNLDENIGFEETGVAAVY